MFIAIEIILSRFLSINAWNMKIGLNFIPIVLCAMLFGPIYAGIVAALADFLGATLFPIGAYFPGFTLTALITGIIFGLFLYKKQNALCIICSVSINQLLLSLLLNTFWISLLYDAPFIELLISRIPQCAILFIIQISLIFLLRKLMPNFKRMLNI